MTGTHAITGFGTALVPLGRVAMAGRARRGARAVSRRSSDPLVETKTLIMPAGVPTVAMEHRTSCIDAFVMGGANG